MHEPARVGEIALLPRRGREVPFGRGDSAGAARLRFVRQRPGSVVLTPDLQAPAVSREQLRLTAGDGVVHVESVGRCDMLIGGHQETTASLRPGDTLHLRNQVSLLMVERLLEMPRLDLEVSHPFGTADRHGLIGESDAIWRARHQIQVVANVSEHLLVIGEPGSGVSTCVEAVHRSSGRAKGPLVVRRAAEIAPGDLAGDAHERGGLLDVALGGTLVVDTMEDLEPRSAATLARLLDTAPAATGDASPGIPRIIATTREPQAAPTLASRLPLRLEVPPLGARIEDIPLLLRGLALRAVATAPELSSRFVDPSTGEVRVDPRLVTALFSHPLPGNVRGLDLLVWTSIAESTDDYLSLTEGAARELGLGPGGARAEPSREDVERALERHGGNQSRAYRDLGLSNRFALIRLMKKHGIGPRAR